MRTLAHGVDMVEVARIRAMLERHEQRFLERVPAGSPARWLQRQAPASRFQITETG
jgi:phosphopantetheinyl transferase (holo-ACP synthase)